MAGMKGISRTPGLPTRLRRDISRLASDADMFSGAITIDAQGNVTLNIATNAGLIQTAGLSINLQAVNPSLQLLSNEIGVKIKAAGGLAVDAGGLYVDTSGLGLVPSSRQIIAGTGLSGGGDLTVNRTLALDINSLTEDTTPDSTADFVATYDASAATEKKVKLQNLPGGGGGSVDIQTYQTPGSTPTWNKPAGAKVVRVVCIGGGGGGGGGSCEPSGQNRRGGTGGGGGAYQEKTFLASELPSSMVVTVGAGGTVGAAGTEGGTAGNGGTGGTSSFATSGGAVYVAAYGGGGGVGGLSSAAYATGGSGGGTGSAGAVGSGAMVPGGQPRYDVETSPHPGRGGGGADVPLGSTAVLAYSAEYGGGCGGSVGTAVTTKYGFGGRSMWGGGGGGGGGSIAAAGTTRAAGPGGTSGSSDGVTSPAGGGGGAAGSGGAGTPGADGSSLIGGAGGGGGDFRAGVPGYAGGAGGACGGGGGGGGCATSSTPGDVGGAGGLGGRGEVRVYSW